VWATLWPQTLFTNLYRHLHGFFVSMRRGADAGNSAVSASDSGSRRRRVAADFPSDPAGKLPATETRPGAGRVRVGRGGCAGAGPHVWRLADRSLLLAVELLHQPSDRHS